MYQKQSRTHFRVYSSLNNETIQSLVPPSLSILSPFSLSHSLSLTLSPSLSLTLSLLAALGSRRAVISPSGQCRTRIAGRGAPRAFYPCLLGLIAALASVDLVVIIWVFPARNAYP